MTRINLSIIQTLVLILFIWGIGAFSCNANSATIRVYNNTGQIVEMVTLLSEDSQRTFMEIFPGTYSAPAFLNLKGSEDPIKLSYEFAGSDFPIRNEFNVADGDEIEVWLLKENLLRIMPLTLAGSCANVISGIPCTNPPDESICWKMMISAKAMYYINPCHRLYSNCNREVQESCIVNAIELDQCDPETPTDADGNEVDEPQYPMGYDVADVTINIQLQNCNFEAETFVSGAGLDIEWTEDPDTEEPIDLVKNSGEGDFWYGTGDLSLLGKFKLENDMQCRINDFLSLVEQEDAEADPVTAVTAFGRTRQQGHTRVIEIWLDDGTHEIQDKLKLQLDWDYNSTGNDVSGALSFNGSNCTEDGFGIHIRADHRPADIDPPLEDRLGWYYIYDLAGSIKQISE